MSAPDGDLLWLCPITVYRPAYLAAKERWVPGWHPQRQDVTWAQMQRALTTHKHVASKEEAWTWSPVILDGDRRCNEAVRSVTAIVLDLDSGGDIEAQIARWLGWPHIVHSTWSHTPEHPKARIVVPLEVPVPVAYWPRAWRWAQRQAGQAADEQAKDASRVYFMPSCPTWAREHAFARVHDEPTSLCDLRPFDALPPAYEAPARPVAPIRHGAPATGVPNDHEADRVTRERWASDPSLRRMAADRSGAKITGNRAAGATCPGCGRPSVYWFIEGNRAGGALCGHRKTCGWSGPLWEVCGG